MKKFMFLIREDLSKLAAMSETELQEDIAAMTAWAEELAAGATSSPASPLSRIPATCAKTTLRQTAPSPKQGNPSAGISSSKRKTSTMP